MSASHVVVDGSNIATEGRSAPSLRQLDDAVRQFQDEFPETETVVVVDATFGHRIDPSERKAFDEAVSHGELVSPPAGAIGRGDAFVLRIAERVGGQVLSNDSFQEFHADHLWLFDEGRLIGGKPVPNVGWIFTPRRPVRGPRSRSGAEETGRPRVAAGSKTASGAPRRRRGRSAAVLDAVEAAAAEATLAATNVEPAPEKPEEREPRRTRRPRRRARSTASGDPTVAAAIEAAKEEAIGPRASEADVAERAPKTVGAADSPQAVNDPLTFVRFITEHPLGDEMDGVVSNFVSHGAMVDVGDMHCYVPLSGLAVPPPKSARAVLKKGEHRRFVVVRLDPPRRGAQLALAELRDVLGLDLPKPRRRRGAAKVSDRPEPGASRTGAKTPKTAKEVPARPAKSAKSAKAAKSAKSAKAAKSANAANAAKAAKPAEPGMPKRAGQPPKGPSARPGAGAQGDNVSKTSKGLKGPAKTSRTTKSATTKGKPGAEGAARTDKGAASAARGPRRASPRQRRDKPHGE